MVSVKHKCPLGKARRWNLKKVLAILRLLLRLGQYCVVLFGTHLCPKVLTIYKNHPGGNLYINIKLWNLTWWENHTLQSTFKSAGQAESSLRKNCITSNHSPYFLKLPKWNGSYHLIFQPGFLGFPRYLVSFLRNLVIAVKEATASPKQSRCTIAHNTFPVSAQPLKCLINVAFIKMSCFPFSWSMFSRCYNHFIKNPRMPHIQSRSLRTCGFVFKCVESIACN